jgi:carboxypeptidase D
MIRARVGSSYPLFLKLAHSHSIEFVVDGAAIPDVNFDIGESYAGLLPISDKANETSELYFWFVPSEKPKASDEILIWLNGGVS